MQSIASHQLLMFIEGTLTSKSLIAISPLRYSSHIGLTLTHEVDLILGRVESISTRFAALICLAAVSVQC